jgi:hypothetical protein
MEKINRINQANMSDDLGLLLQRLEEFENFYPCYKTLIKKE